MSNYYVQLVAMVCILTWYSHEGFAATLHVPESIGTLEDAIEVAQPGDSILISPGYYVGDGFHSLVINNLGITIRSADTAQRAVISLEGGWLLNLPTGEFSWPLVVIEDLVVQGADSAFLFGSNRHWILRGCELRANFLGARLSSLTLGQIDSCLFVDNFAGIVALNEAGEVISRCQFLRNGWGIDSYGVSDLLVQDCVFAENVTAMVFDHLGNQPTLRNVLYRNLYGVRVLSSYSGEAILCSGFWANDSSVAGVMDDQIGINGNFSADPHFCDTTFATGLSVTDLSPLLPANNSCATLIGNVSIGCDCCFGTRGNVDDDPSGSADISDLQGCVDFLFFSSLLPVCLLEADVFPDGQVDISDLQKLVDYLFFSAALPVCP